MYFSSNFQFTDKINSISDDFIAEPFFNSFMLTIGIATLALVALILTICVIITIRYRLKNLKRKKKPKKQVYSVARGNVAVMADLNRLSPRFSKIPMTLSPEHLKPRTNVASHVNFPRVNIILDLP